jgi:hypothetical protein
MKRKLKKLTLTRETLKDMAHAADLRPGMYGEHHPLHRLRHLSPLRPLDPAGRGRRARSRQPRLSRRASPPMETIPLDLELPLLDGPLAERAWLAVDAIAADLALPTAAAPGADWSLSAGAAGRALFFAYLDRARPDRGHDETALDLFEAAAGELGESWAKPGLYGGFAGVGWTLEHLREMAEPDDGGDPGEEIAATLAGLLRQTPWSRSRDLIGGLVGIGVYALERLPLAGGRECLELAVVRLAETAEAGPRGIAWFTAPELLPDDTREIFPRGYYNAGVAHGVPGMIALLAAAARHGARAGEAVRLCEGAVEWLAAHRLGPDATSLYPYSVLPDGPPPRRSSRLAWCYGDLGIAAALLAAARALGRDDWERQAIAAGHAAAGRFLDGSGVRDAGLCHGAAGVGHLFHRLFRGTGEPRFGEAARHWLGEALALRRPGDGFGGFLAYDGVDLEAGGSGWRADSGFLEGSAGVGLALLAALDPGEPAWDRVLLASTRP